MKNRLNKKGELLGEETFGNILAWISVSLVVIAAILIYFNFKAAKSLEQAKNSLEEISKAIIKLNQDVSLTSKDILIPNPLNWNLIGYDVTQTRPGQCSKGSDCICICPKPGLKTQMELCVKKGACVDVYDIRPFEAILIKATQLNYISLKKVDGEILIQEKKE